MGRIFWRYVASVGLVMSLALPCGAAPLVLDGFTYSNNASARIAWVAQAGSSPVEMADSGEWGSELVMKLPCSATIHLHTTESARTGFAG
ncbi:MAG: hypothetical protein C0404_04440 [Verrucomicrobia bacterium]|nr:hypothetical protein [Verrucomicrobiota bacterium]